MNSANWLRGLVSKFHSLPQNASAIARWASASPLSGASNRGRREISRGWAYYPFLGRALVFPDSFRRLFDHPVQSLFIGCIPMGFATIVNGMIMIWPMTANSALWAYGWWWVDAVLAVISVLLVPFFMFTSQVHSLERMTAAWLLPIVPPEVAAASGGLVAQHVAPWLGVPVIYVSYVFWAVSVLLSLGILTILFLRLALHRLPHRDMAVSSWLPLGPIGTGAMAMITLGDADGHVFIGTTLMPMAQFGHMAGLMVALLLWGFGIWWLCMAVFFTLRYLGVTDRQYGAKTESA